MRLVPTLELLNYYYLLITFYPPDETPFPILTVVLGAFKIDIELELDI